MKFKHVLTTAAVLSILLAGCGSNEKQEDTQKHEEKEKTNHQKAEKKENTQHEQTSKHEKSHTHKQTTEQAISQLTPQEKVALALYAPKTAEFTVTANELLNHSYVQNGNGGSRQREIQQLTLYTGSSEIVTNKPQNMVIYGTTNSKGPFAAVIGVSDTQVLVSGTQGINPYQQLANMGAVYNLKDLYKQYKDEPNFKQVANLIRITNQDAQSAAQESNSNSSSESHSSSSEGKVTRANVIDKVEEYEGHKLDTSTYTYKEPEQKSDGSWGFSFVDKSDDLAGSYIVNADGSVEKFDSKGQPE